MEHKHEHSCQCQHGPGHHHGGGRKWHRDWRIWAMVILMLIAMAVYVLTLDLR